MDGKNCSAEPEQVPAESKATLDAFTKEHRLHAEHDGELRAEPDRVQRMGHAAGRPGKGADVKTRDGIGLAVSEVNGCNYCLAVHSFAGRASGHNRRPMRLSLPGKRPPTIRSATRRCSLRARSSRRAAR